MTIRCQILDIKIFKFYNKFYVCKTRQKIFTIHCYFKFIFFPYYNSFYLSLTQAAPTEIVVAVVGQDIAAITVMSGQTVRKRATSAENEVSVTNSLDRCLHFNKQVMTCGIFDCHYVHLIEETLS